MPRFFSRLLLLLACACANLAAQSTIHVPADRSTIQSAIDNSVSGDTILVAPGTYTENIDFKGKNITVKSEQGAAVTTINGNNVAPVVYFHTSEGNLARLEGFTITNGTAPASYSYSGGGVKINHASPTVIHNIITGNRSCSGGSGVDVEFSSAIIQENTITNNAQNGCSGGSGGGIYVGGSGSVQVIANVVSGNTHSDGGGITLFAAGNAIVKNNVISGNSVFGQGGGMYVVNTSNEQVIQNLIYGNSAQQGAGIYTSTLTKYINNTVVNNTGGSAIYAFNWATLPFYNNIVIAAAGQNAIACSSSSGTFTPNSNLLYSPDTAAVNSSCSPGSTVGFNGNISASPGFLDSANNDYRLSSSSPAIDAGTSTGITLQSIDLDGNTRVFDGDSNGVAKVDIGAYEYVTTTATALPSPLVFSPQPIFTSSTAQDVTVTNTGTAKLRVNQIQSIADYSFTSTCINVNLDPAATCVIHLTLSPTHRGALNRQLILKANVAGGQISVDVQGSGTGAAVQLSATSLSFGSRAVGTTSSAQDVTVTNTSEAVMHIASIQGSGDYGVTHDCPASLNVASSCTIHVTFTPTTRGARSGSVTMQSDAEGTPHSVILSGTGTGPSLALSASQVAFPTPQLYGTTSAPLSVTLTNDGEAALSITSITSIDEFPQTNNCPASLAPGANCAIQVSFAPGARGVRNGAITIVDGAPQSPHSISLSGTGVAGVLSITADSLDFGNTVVGASSSRGFTVQNTGDATLNIPSITTSGDFLLLTGCPSTLAVNSICAGAVKFSPTAAGLRLGNLQFTTNAPGSPTVIPMTGTGVLLSFDPAEPFIAETRVGGTSAPFSIQLTNASNASVTLTNITTTSEFGQTNDCGPSLAAGAHCTINVTFSPQTVGYRTGTLRVFDDAVGSPHSIPLVGFAFVPHLTATFFTFDFGALLNGTSITQRIYLSADITGPVTLGPISVSAPFTQTNNCPAVLPKITGCYIDVTFSPTADGSFQRALALPNDDPNASQVINLSGAGISSYPLPVITNLGPDNIEAAFGDWGITVYGSNFFPTTKVRFNGQDRPTEYVSNSQLQVSFTPDDIGTLNPGGITTFTPGPGGGLSGPAYLTIYRTFPIEAKNLLWDPFSRRLIATIASNASNNANKVVVIDPQTGEIERSLLLNFNPDKLALSQTGKTLYVALSGTNAVQKIDVPSWTPTLQFTLGSSNFTGPFSVEDMAVIPGTEDSLVVARRNNGFSPRHEGVAIYDNGVMRPTTSLRTSSANSITFGSSASMVFAFNNETTEFGFRRLAITSSGISITDVNTSLGMGGFNSTIRSDGSRIFSSNGRVLNPAGSASVGALDLTGMTVASVLPMSYPKRAMYLGNDSSTSIPRLRVFDSDSLLKLGQLKFGYNQRQVRSVSQWGNDGVAFPLEDSFFNVQLVIARSGLLSPGSGDGMPVINSISPASVAAGTSNTIFDLNGTGFTAGMRVFLDGKEVSAVPQSAEQLRIYVPASMLASQKVASLSVRSATSDTQLASSTLSITGSSVAFGDAPQFAAQMVGRRSQSITVDLHNNGATPVSVSSVSVTGDFSITHSCTTIANGASCPVQITFLPTATGTRTGTLSASASGNVTALQLSADGFDILLNPRRASRPSRTAPSVANKEEAWMAVQGLALDQVSLTCSGAPAGTACSVTGTPTSATEANLSVSLESRGGRATKGTYPVTITAAVGEFTKQLTLSVAYEPPATSRARRLSRSLR